VVKGLINQKFNAITIRRIDIIHMNVGRNSMTRTSKVKISEVTQIHLPTLCLWHVLIAEEIPTNTPIECNIV